MQALMSAPSMRNFFEHQEESSFPETTVIGDVTPFESLSIDDIPAEDPSTISPNTKDCNELQRLRIKNTSRTSPNGNILGRNSEFLIRTENPIDRNFGAKIFSTLFIRIKRRREIH